MMEDILISLEGFTNIFPLHHTERETCKRLWVLESMRKRDIEYLKLLLPFLSENYQLKVECIKTVTRVGWVDALRWLITVSPTSTLRESREEISTGWGGINIESLKFLTPYFEEDIFEWDDWDNQHKRNTLRDLKIRICEEKNQEAFKHIWEYLPRSDRYWNLGMVCTIIHSYKALPEEEKFLKMLDRLKGFGCSPYDETPNRRFSHGFYGPLRWWWLRRFSKVKQDEKNERMMGKIKKLQISLLLALHGLPLYAGKIILEQCGCFVLFIK